MSRSLKEVEEEIKPIIEDCKAANDTYFTYLRKYVEELIIADAKLDNISERKQLRNIINLKKILYKDTLKIERQIKELDEPITYTFPTNLNDIYGTIDRILVKRGWVSRKEWALK